MVRGKPDKNLNDNRKQNPEKKQTSEKSMDDINTS